MFSYNLVLIGFMGTGKSTVAKYLSKQYHMDIIEMDALIEPAGDFTGAGD